jgi:hypothetical protein
VAVGIGQGVCVAGGPLGQHAGRKLQLGGLPLWEDGEVLLELAQALRAAVAGRWLRREGRHISESFYCLAEAEEKILAISHPAPLDREANSQPNYDSRRIGGLLPPTAPIHWGPPIPNRITRHPNTRSILKTKYSLFFFPITTRDLVTPDIYFAPNGQQQAGIEIGY